MNASLKILLADDHTIFRHGLKLFLQSQAGYAVVAEAASLELVPPLLQQNPVDLMILDYDMPGGESSAVLSYCKHRYADLKVIALTGTESGIVLKQLRDANADAVLLKDVSGPELLRTIVEVMAGQTVIGADVQQLIAGCDTDLTARELQTMQLIYQGLSNADMAVQLNLSVKTVDKHRENLMRKLQVTNIAQLIHKVRLLGLV